MQTCIGLIGCGKWGSNILRDLLALGCRVTAVDPAAAGREHALRMGAEHAAADSAALDGADLDGYVIASPVNTLAIEAENALRRGKPVFCEKPAFQSPAEQSRLEAAGAAERLFVMYKFCYHPGIEALRELITGRDLGRPQTVMLHRCGWDDDFQGSDCLWLAGVHQFAIVHYLLGHIPVVRSTTLVCQEGVTVAAQLTLGGRLPVMISVSSRSPIKTVSAAVCFACGTALLPDAHAQAILIKMPGRPVETRSISTELPLALELKEFVAHLQGGARPRCGFPMAIDVSEAIRMALES